MKIKSLKPTLVKTEGWLFNRFGDHVAAISTNTMLRLKSSIKDVARSIHGHVDGEIEKLCKTLPQPPQGIDDSDFIFGYTGDDGKEVKGLIEQSKELQTYRDTRPKEWAIVKKMLGICRSKSRHPCAFVIANEPIHNFIPISSISGVRTTQYTAESVEARGGVKMDFLGLNSLNDLQQAVRLVQRRHGGEVKVDSYINNKRVPGIRMVPNPITGVLMDVWDLPEDQAVFRDIAESLTETVFQLNTNSAKQWLRQFNYWKSEQEGVKAIDSIEAVSAFTALDRPGPLDAEVKGPDGKAHNMLIEYANRAKGKPGIGRIEALDKMFPETYGVLIYQEQIESCYKDLTGCTASEAEEFRRLAAKKKMAKVKELYPAFMERASAKIGQQQAQEVFEQIVTFSQYGFNRSHSISYSVIAYACAYLKHYYPTEWWCAVLSNANKKEIAEKFWKHSKHWIDMPDVRYSGEVFEIQNGRIRAPLSFLLGVGAGAHKELTDGRPFTDIKDFCRKIILHKKAGNKAVVDADGNPVLDAKKKPKIRSGTSALNSGVVSRLIISGVADSLFPPELSTLEKLQMFQDELANAANEINGTKKKPGKVSPKYLDMTALKRYQLQKEILSIHSEDLQPLVAGLGFNGINKSTSNKVDFVFDPTDKDMIANILNQKGGKKKVFEALPLLNGQQLKFLNDEAILEDGDVIAGAALVYVQSERRFTYEKKGTRHQALELMVDIDGEQFKFIKWPDRETGKLKCPEGDLGGSIVIINVTRYKKDRPFAVDAIVIVQEKLTETKEESSSES